MPQFNPYASPLVVSQTAIPVIIPSSGSIGNNGALTLTTALPLVYANAYLYFPASAIVTGSAAGFYLCQMTSTTVGVIYNNTIAASGDVRLPLANNSNSSLAAVTLALTPFVTTGPGAYTQTTATNLVMATIPVSGGSMGPYGSLRITDNWSCLNSAGAKVSLINFAATAIHNVSQTTTATLQNISIVRNRGAQNVQTIRDATSVAPYGTGTTAATQAAIDTSVAQNLAFIGNLAVATDYLILEGFTVEVIQGV